MPTDFTIQVQHTYLDYVELNRATWRTLITRVLLTVAGIGLIVSAFAHVRNQPVLLIHFPPMIWGIVLFLLATAVPWLAALRPWLRQQAHTLFTLRVTEEEIKIAGRDSSVRYSWTKFSHYTETHNLVLLWHASPAVLLAVTKRSLRDGNVIEEFQRLVEAKLVRAARVRTGARA